MAAILEILGRVWKGVLVVVLVLSTVGAILAIPTHIATPADIDKLKVETDAKIAKSKAEVNDAIQAVVKHMELKGDLDRLNQVNDTLVKAKMQQRQYPKDKDIADDVESLKKNKTMLEGKVLGR